MNLKNVVTFILDVEAHEYQHTNRREPSHPDCATASHLLSVSDAKKVMKKLLTDSLCLLTKTQPYQRPRSAAAFRGRRQYRERNIAMENHDRKRDGKAVGWIAWLGILLLFLCGFSYCCGNCTDSCQFGIDVFGGESLVGHQFSELKHVDNISIQRRKADWSVCFLADEFCNLKILLPILQGGFYCNLAHVPPVVEPAVDNSDDPRGNNTDNRAAEGNCQRSVKTSH